MSEINKLEKELYQLAGLRLLREQTHAEIKAIVENNASPLRILMDEILVLLPNLNMKEKVTNERGRSGSDVSIELLISESNGLSTLALTMHSDKCFYEGKISIKDDEGNEEYYRNYSHSPSIAPQQAPELLVKWVLEYAEGHGIEKELADNLYSNRQRELSRKNRGAFHEKIKKDFKP